jgi:hypothetical protein
MKTPVLLHVGYHKTATTWMQNLLFTQRHGYRQIANHEEVFSYIVRPSGHRFDPAQMSKLIIERKAQLSPGEIPVISSEILSGNPFYGGRESELYAERLHKVLPGARILISIRNQTKIIASVYMQYLLRGGTMPYNLFFEGTNEPGYFAFAPEHFEYDLLIANYQRLFGRENVFILTQESLIKDMDAASEKLANFIGHSTFPGLQPEARRLYAPSYPEYTCQVLRRINHIQRSTLNPSPIVSFGTTPLGLYRICGYVLRRDPFKALFGHRKPVTDYVRRRFKGTFSESNMKLAKIATSELDLSDYP